MNATELIDPEIAAMLELLPFDHVGPENVGQLRMPMPPMPLSDRVERTDHLVPGDPPVPVRVHRAKDTTGLLPCVYSIHGGGFVIGSYDMDDARFDGWCPQLGIVGVSVEYRLAPETPYPGPLEDCYAGLKWTYEHADELGIDGSRIGVHGVSAGGGLAAGLALLARDRGEVPLAFQVLDCPMLDDRQRTTSSQVEDLAVWSKQSNEFGWRSYLGQLYGTDHVPYAAAPARALDLTGSPTAFISVGAIDGFRDEDVDYALRLNDANVPTELHVYPGAPHGYQLAAESAVARQGRRDVEEWLRRQLC